ncbi:DUF3718 domain-containing protein [Paraferrimonas sp. SM1919]|uniref:DUF3718 domain-containing protein n=1 Tax=Paraferrimonas sp. SM1919 TaxID=2662263 RepID=UPI0013D6BBAC|nr:DUF3718 domain-containing protein [Paraferrimonas sp. SM1919]
MKTLTLITICTLGLTNIANADVTFKGTDSTLETQICLAAANGSASDLKSQIKKLAPRRPTAKAYYLAVKNISCNGQSLSNFAAFYGNHKAYAVLTKYSQDTLVTSSGRNK